MFRTRGDARRMGRSPIEIPPTLIPGFFEFLVRQRFRLAESGNMSVKCQLISLIYLKGKLLPGIYV